MVDDCRTEAELDREMGEELKELLTLFTTLDPREKERLLAYLQGAAFVSRLTARRQRGSTH